MKMFKICYWKSYSKLSWFSWISTIYENLKITEKIVEKSPGQLFYCFVLPQRPQKCPFFYATLSFGNQDLTSISEKVSSACTVLLNFHFYTSYCSLEH